MDIRKWFTSPKGTASETSLKNQKAPVKSPDRGKQRSPKKSVKGSKKRPIIESDSDDEEPIPVKKKSQKKSHNSSDEEPIDRKEKEKGSKKKKRSLDEDDAKSGSQQVSKGTKDKKTASNKAKNLPKTEKPVSVADFFGSAPVRRARTVSPKNKKLPQKEVIELNHEDAEFQETLRSLQKSQQIDHTKDTAMELESDIGSHPTKKIKSRKPSSEIEDESSQESRKKRKHKTTPKKDEQREESSIKSTNAESSNIKVEKEALKEIKSRKPSSEIEDGSSQESRKKHKAPKENERIEESSIKFSNAKGKDIKGEKASSKGIKAKKTYEIEIKLSPNPVASKKQNASAVDEVKKTPSTKRKGSTNYYSYLEREGPKSLGSKEMPEGERECLKGKTFVLTGILESITRDDAKELIEKHGGKVMSTLSKKTQYAVIGRDAGPSKLEKVEKFGTKQLDEDSLFELIRTSKGSGPFTKKESVNKSNLTIASPAALGNQHADDTMSQDIDELDDIDFEKSLSDNENSPHNKDIESSSSKTSLLHKVEMQKRPDIQERLKDTNIDCSPSKKQKTAIKEKPSSVPSLEMWVDKYKPTSTKQIIGQQGDKSNAKKLLRWLINWSKNCAKNKKTSAAGKWGNQDDGSTFKAALLSGPPGVGKTTTAQLVCKEANFDYFELNASDTRSKKTLQQVVSELLKSQSLAGCFKGESSGLSRNHVIIMDEVDGMAGNEDRGGVQELIGLIKASKIPIICICNDRNHPKIRSLSNYCFDLRFQRPRVEQIKAAMLSITYKEGVDVAPNVIQDVITASNQDIRQVLHNLSLWSEKSKGLTAEQAKADISFGTKNIKLGPFDVLREVFSIGNNPKSTINDKAALFFHDYSIAPLFVQENYVHVLPKAASGSKVKHLELLSSTAESICTGDIIDKQIRSHSSWSLLPVQALFASVIPGELMTGHLKQMISFPSWLGKNSSRNHMDRILQELQMHMRMKITGNKTDIVLEYLPLLKHALTKPLLDKELDGVKDALKVMEYYYLLREDFDSVIDLSLWSNQADPRSKISAKVKSAFTRTYNKECGHNPYAVTNVSKKKKGTDSGELGLEDDVDGDEEDEESDKIENDAMIKVKKPAKKGNASDATSSKTNTKTTSKRGRPKK